MIPLRVAALALFTLAAAIAPGAQMPGAGQTHAIDAARSTLTVFAYKAGLFSAFADNHVIQAPIAGGSVSQAAPRGVQVSIRSAALKVLDPGLSDSKRAEVQTRMLGPEVLDSAKYPDINFASTAIEAAGADRWTVTGRLTIHGVTRSATFLVAEQSGRYRGSATLKQRDFGIEPISIVGGTVKVKDEIKVEFDIVPETGR